MTGDEDADKIASDIGGKAIAAVVGGVVGGLPGALVAVAVEPVFVHMAARSWEELSNVRRRSAGYMLQSASEQLGGPPDDVVARSLMSEDSAQLFADALQSAAMTSNEQKIRALGRALASEWSCRRSGTRRRGEAGRRWSVGARSAAHSTARPASAAALSSDEHANLHRDRHCGPPRCSSCCRRRSERPEHRGSEQRDLGAHQNRDGGP